MSARILIVEDNVDLLTILQEVLSADYDVVTAESGEAAVALARTLDPDLVLLDIHLPGISGIEAGIQIKQNAARPLPILVLTALARNEEGGELIASGCCDAVVVKPAPLPTIRAKVNELLYSHTEIT